MTGKFIAAQMDLLALLASMQPICSKRTTLDVTESILFQVAPRELTLKATDLEISLQSSMAIESDVSEVSSFLISGKRIFELVKELDGEIEFNINHNQISLKSGGVDLSLNIRDSQEFPPFPERIENLIDFKASFILDMINKVSFVIPQNNSNTALNGMLLEINANEMCMIATDGHSLAHVTTTKYLLLDEKKWLLPKRAVMEIKKLFENSGAEDSIFLGTCGNQLVFSGKNFNFFTKLISDAFPAYKPVLEKEGFLPATVVKDSLLRTLKRTSCLLAGQFVSTTFKFAPGTLKVNMHNKEVGKLDEELAINEFEGNEIESRFYAPYILNGLQVFPEKSIQFFIKNGARPIIFETHDDNFVQTYLVMPISLSQS
jgi:DNA polymerase-3 subunit beta